MTTRTGYSTYELTVPLWCVQSGGEEGLMDRFLDYIEDEGITPRNLSRNQIRNRTGIEVHDYVPADNVDDSVTATVYVWWL